MSEQASPIIESKDLWRTYKQGKIETHALRGVDLKIFPAEFAAVCGPSGSGKTTFLNIVGGLDKADKGDLLLEGRSLNQYKPTELSHLRRDRIGFVFQAYNLIPVLTAYENAEFVMLLQHRPAAERRRITMEILEKVGLKGLENRFPNEMSGGQQQRVAIARAIAINPAVVLADEPTANVDSETADNLMSLMEELNKEHGITFVFSTHDPRVMERAKRLVTLKDGQVYSDELN